MKDDFILFKMIHSGKLPINLVKFNINFIIGL